MPTNREAAVLQNRLGLQYYINHVAWGDKQTSESLVIWLFTKGEVLTGKSQTKALPY